MAAPILNANGAVVGAINITGPADRLTATRIDELWPRLLHVCANVMRQLAAENVLTLARSPDGNGDRVSSRRVKPTSGGRRA